MNAIINTWVSPKSGGNSKYNEDLGRITTSIFGESEGSISVDSFKGQGKYYERRNDAEISICYEGELEFKGTLTELISKLNK